MGVGDRFTAAESGEQAVVPGSIRRPGEIHAKSAGRVFRSAFGDTKRTLSDGDPAVIQMQHTEIAAAAIGQVQTARRRCVGIR